MKFLFVLVLVFVSVHASDPADWQTCKVTVGKVAVETIFDENMNWSSWPKCHIKLYQSPRRDTFFIYKNKKELWWESNGVYQRIKDGFYKSLPEIELEIKVTGDVLTLNMGGRATKGMVGLCTHSFNWRDPPCVESWGTSGGPPPSP